MDDHAGNQLPPGFEGTLALAQQDDLKALTDLLETARRRLNQIAQCQWPRRLRQRESPSEVVQQAIVDIAANVKKFTGTETAWDAFTAKILKNCIVSRIRWHDAARRSSQRDVPLDGNNSSDHPGGPAVFRDEPSPGSWLGRLELTSILRDYLSQLKPRYQEVLRLRVYEGLSWSEVGTSLGSNADAAQHLFARALRELASRMRPHLTT